MTLLIPRLLPRWEGGSTRTVAPALIVVAAIVAVAPVAAQTRLPAANVPGQFLGGVPEGTKTSDVIPISIAEAIARALEHNLGVRQSQSAVDVARSQQAQALADLLPNIHGSVTETRRKNSLESFGFPLGPAFPRVVGPYNLFEARAFASQPLLDLAASNDARAESHRASAAQHTYQSARETVVLVTANLYLQTIAAAARAESARAQQDTAQALYTQAQDLRQSGIVAGLDVVRAEVRVMGDRQRAVAAANDYEKLKLQLARVMGLPLGQEYKLSSEIPNVPVPLMTLEEALERAYRDRPDYLAAQERVQAAEAARQSAVSEHLPTVHLNADYGVIGLTLPSSLPTFSVAGSVEVPIFQGGRTQAKVSEADAELRARHAEAEDLRAEIYTDVRSAFLDLQATEAEQTAATRGRELAREQLTQSRDRFASGVANNVEVVQAQEAVAIAEERYIEAQYGYDVAKALLARSLGSAEQAVQKYLGGAQ
jgi:outer membrane protein TolC